LLVLPPNFSTLEKGCNGKLIADLGYLESDNKFENWRRAIVNELLVNGGVIGSKRDQWVWIWDTLSEKTQSDLALYFVKGGPDGDYDPAKLLEHLSEKYAQD
jgi:hypothetical protein